MTGLQPEQPTRKALSMLSGRRKRSRSLARLESIGSPSRGACVKFCTQRQYSTATAPPEVQRLPLFARASKNPWTSTLSSRRLSTSSPRAARRSANPPPSAANSSSPSTASFSRPQRSSPPPRSIRTPNRDPDARAPPRIRVPHISTLRLWDRRLYGCALLLCSHRTSFHSSPHAPPRQCLHRRSLRRICRACRKALAHPRRHRHYLRDRQRHRGCSRRVPVLGGARAPQ